MENFNYDIKKIRQKYGLTQEEFADAIDLSREMITMMERTDDKKRPVSKSTKILIDKFIEDQELVTKSELNQREFVERREEYEEEGFVDSELNEKQKATLLLNIAEHTATIKEMLLDYRAEDKGTPKNVLRLKYSGVGKVKSHIIQDALSMMR